MRDDNDEKRGGRVVVQRVVIQDGQAVDADSPEVAAAAIEQLQRSQAREERRREVWGTDSAEQMVRLARSFPSLRTADGLDPWNAVAFLAWAVGPACTSGSWHAAMFVLQVWNSTTDWAQVAREERLVAAGAPGLRHDTARSALSLGLADDAAAARSLDPEVVDRAAHAVTRARCYVFNTARALATWDDAHCEAFLRWVSLPFFP